MRKKHTPNDPDRRERIIDGAIRIMLHGGVGAVTARRVASDLEIPVGSVSYYFDSVFDLLLEASQRLLAARAQRLRDWFLEAAGEEEQIRQLAQLIHFQLTEDRAATVVAYELFMLGLRDARARGISERSVDELRVVLSDLTRPERASHFAAVAEGIQLQALFIAEPPSAAEIETVLRSS